MAPRGDWTDPGISEPNEDGSVSWRPTPESSVPGAVGEPRTEAGRAFFEELSFRETYLRPGTQLAAILAIEQQAAALERHKVVERITTFFDQYEVKERGFILIHGTAAQLARAILDALASEPDR